MTAGALPSGVIKVLIAGVPGLLAAVVRNAIIRERDMDLVAVIASMENLTVVDRGPVDVIVTAVPMTGPGLKLLEVLLGPIPVPVVAISLDGTRIDVFGHVLVRGAGIDGLGKLIREAVHHFQPGGSR